MKKALLLLVGFISSLSGAQMSNGLFVPASGGPMPNYFSGTNCRASGFAQIGDPIIYACLKVEGDIVAEFEWQPGDAMPMAIPLAAVFDSTHFPPGTHVDVSLEVVGLTTGTHTSPTPRSAIVKNKLMAFEHDDSALPGASGTDPSIIVSGTLPVTKYDRMVENGTGWSVADYFAAMSESNVVFFAGHGVPDRHTHGSGSVMTIGNSDYEANRISQIGAGIPPFNSGSPPVNFCHLVSCECGQNNNFIRVAYPYYMAWGGLWMENQSLMAYAVGILLKDCDWHADEIWSRMSQGWTAYYTQQDFDHYISDPANSRLGINVIDSAGTRVMWPGDLACFYNPVEGGCTRVVGVYTGTNALPVSGQWFLQI